MSTYRSSRLDRATAEALLRDDPGVRHGAGRLGEVLAASAAPGYPGELAGLPAALTAYQAAGADPVLHQRRTSMIRTWLTKVLTVKAAAVLAVTAAGGVALAATTGTLPNPLNHGTTVSASHQPDHPTPSAHRSRPGSPGSADPSPNLVGLCHAYTAGVASANGKAVDNPAFTALINAAGGKDKVDTYYKDTLASASPDADHPAASGHPGASDHPTGAPSDHPGPSDHPDGKPSDHPTPSHPTH
jgi:hypothetical protein